MQELQDHDPRQIGPYRVLGLLGGDEMGRVYLASGPHGPVMVKTVHPWLATDDQFRARLTREIRIGRRIQSPWTTAVINADTEGRVPWLATEYVHGVSLDRAVRSTGPLPMTSVHLLAAYMVRALAAVHAAKLVHRDVKPANMLLTVDQPILIDFGIARALDATQLTSKGMAIGTPAFMSPGQADGRETGTASDVFSLASVLVFAATGTGPFGDDTPRAVMRRIRSEPPNLAGVPEPLLTHIARCLSRNPADRPTAYQLADALEPLPPMPRHGWLPPTVTALIPALPSDPPRPPAPSRPAGPPPTAIAPEPAPPSPGVRPTPVDEPPVAPVQPTPQIRATNRQGLLIAGASVLAALGGLTWLLTSCSP